MRRREFIKVLAGSAAAWPLAVRAQQREQMRRVTVLLVENWNSMMQADKAEVAAFEGGLKELGWNFRPKCRSRLSLAGRSSRPGARRRKRNCRRASRSCSQPLDAGHGRTDTPACQLSSCWLPIRPAQDLCKIWDTPVAISPDSQPLNLPLAANGSRC